MNVSAASTISGGEPPPIYHRSHLAIANQPHLQQQQLIQQHLQQKYQQQHTANESSNTKDEGSSGSTSSSRKTSASSFFAAIRPRSKSDSVRRTSQKIQNHLLTSDRVIRFLYRMICVGWFVVVWF